MIILLALVGAAAIAGGLALVSPPLALIALGVFLLLAARGYALQARKPTDG